MDVVDPKLQDQITNTIITRVINRISPALTEENILALEEMQGDEDQTKLLQYLKETIPNFDAIIKEETLSYKQELEETLSSL